MVLGTGQVEILKICNVDFLFCTHTQLLTGQVGFENFQILLLRFSDFYFLTLVFRL